MRGKRPASNEARRLAATSEAGYWRQIDRRQRRRLSISRVGLRVGVRAAQLRQDGRVLADLLRSVPVALVGTAVVVAVLEAAAGALHHLLRPTRRLRLIRSYRGNG